MGKTDRFDSQVLTVLTFIVVFTSGLPSDRQINERIVGLKGETIYRRSARYMQLAACRGFQKLLVMATSQHLWSVDSHLTHDSLGPPEPTTQTASRSVQPFLQG